MPISALVLAAYLKTPISIRENFKPVDRTQQFITYCTKMVSHRTYSRSFDYCMGYAVREYKDALNSDQEFDFENFDH